MKINKIEISKPKCDDNCRLSECKYCEMVDGSFDHEFGTRYEGGYECNYDFVTGNGYGDCYKVDDFLEENGLDYTNMVDALEVE